MARKSSSDSVTQSVFRTFPGSPHGRQGQADRVQERDLRDDVKPGVG